jgi:hypothetical protein
VLEALFAIVSLVGSAGDQTPKLAQVCPGVEASILRVIPIEFRRGTQPRFALTLRNASKNPVRLVDIRDGRRPDLADSYYEIIFGQNGQELDDPRAISDPGPVDAVDFFVLPPGATVETPLTTPADLTRLAVGQYSAHVRITLDPFSERTPKCRSSRTSFSVRE